MPKLRLIYRRDGMEFTSDLIVDLAPETGDDLDILEFDGAIRTYKVEAIYPVRPGNLVTNGLRVLDADRVDYVVQFETYGAHARIDTKRERDQATDMRDAVSRN